MARPETHPGVEGGGADEGADGSGSTPPADVVRPGTGVVRPGTGVVRPGTGVVRPGTASTDRRRRPPRPAPWSRTRPRGRSSRSTSCCRSFRSSRPSRDSWTGSSRPSRRRPRPSWPKRRRSAGSTKRSRPRRRSARRRRRPARPLRRQVGPKPRLGPRPTPGRRRSPRTRYARPRTRRVRLRTRRARPRRRHVEPRPRPGRRRPGRRRRGRRRGRVRRAGQPAATGSPVPQRPDQPTHATGPPPGPAAPPRPGQAPTSPPRPGARPAPARPYPPSAPPIRRPQRAPDRRTGYDDDAPTTRLAPPGEPLRHWIAAAVALVALGGGTAAITGAATPPGTVQFAAGIDTGDTAPILSGLSGERAAADRGWRCRGDRSALRRPGLRRTSVAASIVDVLTGDPLYDVNGTTAMTPASAAKLLTAAAVLQTRGPSYRIATRAVAGSSPGEVVLVGGGDPDPRRRRHHARTAARPGWTCWPSRCVRRSAAPRRPASSSTRRSTRVRPRGRAGRTPTSRAASSPTSPL